MKEFVITVDENDVPTGQSEKLEAHQKALLHRAFSVFIFNDKGELLLQQRALSKYHSGGLWTNTCCGHPRPGENTLDAAKRRLYEEMGFTCEIEHQFTFTYRAELDNELTEYEIDHVYFGKFNASPSPNKAEVNAYKWIDLKTLSSQLDEHPEHFTAWLSICFPKVLQVISE